LAIHNCHNNQIASHPDEKEPNNVCAQAVGDDPRGSEYDDDYDDDLDDYIYDDYGEKKPSSSGSGAPAETSAFNFVRLLVLRIVWGFASMFGLQEGLEDFMGGIFVPPGVETDDDLLGF